MDKTVADLNIEHFKKLLETETDPVKRQRSNGCSPKKGPNWRLPWPTRLQKKVILSGFRAKDANASG